MTIFRKHTQVVEDVPALTAQFVLTLRSIVTQVSERWSADGARKPAALLRIEHLLEQTATWEVCYEIEQQVIPLFDPVALRSELARRLLEAQGVLRADVLDYYRAAARDGSDDQQRVLLARLVNDLQWRYTVGEMRRQFMREVTSKTGWGMVFVAIPFVLVAIASARDAALAPLVAAVAGAFGASFSMLTGLKTRFDQSSFDDLKLARTNALIVSRIVIGAAAAAILYFFIRSGLVAGAAFPKLDGAAALEVGAFAHLVVWCFVAGFSEKLIPTLLAQAEARADGGARGERHALPAAPTVQASGQTADQGGAKAQGGTSQEAKPEPSATPAPKPGQSGPVPMNPPRTGT
jgi:hypothetical protein